MLASESAPEPCLSSRIPLSPGRSRAGWFVGEFSPQQESRVATVVVRGLEHVVTHWQDDRERDVWMGVCACEA